MTVEEIKTKLRDDLDRLSEPLLRDQYRSLIEELHSEMQCRLDCLNEEDAADE